MNARQKYIYRGLLSLSLLSILLVWFPEISRPVTNDTLFILWAVFGVGGLVIYCVSVRHG